MGILAGLFEKRFHVSQEPPGWVKSMYGWDTAAGVDINEEQALNYTAVLACVRILAESVAALPLHVYERLDNGGKQRAESFYLYPLLHSEPNTEMSSFQLREVMMSHLALWGNAYANLVYDSAGRVAEIWPLRPDRMSVKREKGQLKYFYQLTKTSEAKQINNREIMHIPGFGSNGVTGYSMISLARQGVALGLATEEYGSRFFGNGARPGGVLQHPGKLSQEAHDRLQSSWEKSHSGLSKAHRVAILEEGLTFHEIGMPPEDAQFLETRKFQRNEIAMIYRVPPHMLADLERATFSNIEHQSIDFVVHTVQPWLVRWEQAMQRTLFRQSEKSTYFVQFLVDGLLRGDTVSRFNAYAVGRQNGWLSANDIRELENMNPIDGGDVYLIPLNMVPVGNPPQSPLEGGGEEDGEESDRNNPLQSENPPQSPLKGGGEMRTEGDTGEQAANRRHVLMGSQRRVFQDVLRRILRRERNDVRGGARKLLKDGVSGIAQFYEWLETFYAEHQSFIGEQLFPVTMAYGEIVSDAAYDEMLGLETAPPHIDDLGERIDQALEAFIHEYIRVCAVRNTARNAEKIRTAVQKAAEVGEDLVEAVDEVVEPWPEERSVVLGDEEAVRSNNAVAELVYSLAGVLTVRWFAFGDSCPYCKQLNGKVVGIKKVFLPVGDYQPDGADKPLIVERDVRHPPAHGGCDCMIVCGV